MDPFSTFGLTPTFDLPLTALTERYRELSRVVHPDRFAGAAAGERRRALSKAVDVNEAWRQLRDPLRRAEALLRRLGVSVEETGQPPATAALLMTMMEAREQLSHAKQAGDLGAVQRCAAWGAERETQVTAELAAWFKRVLANHTTTTVAPAEAETALAWLGELRYLRRLLDETQAVEEQLLDPR